MDSALMTPPSRRRPLLVNRWSRVKLSMVLPENFARIDVFIALAGRISGQALDVNGHITVNGQGDIGMHIKWRFVRHACWF